MQWIAQTELGISCISRVLDDFIIVITSPVQCLQQIKAFIYLWLDIGISTSLDKTCGTNEVITYLGYDLYSVGMEARLPQVTIPKCVHK